jgi:hypothetical protein
MNIDALTFRTMAKAIVGEAVLTAGEARAIVQLGYLASGADLEEDSEEVTLREQLTRHVCALAGISVESVPRPSPLPMDREERIAWLLTLCRKLTTSAASELAYVVAYLLAIGDLELAPVEATFLFDLQRVLGLGDARASELVAHAAEQITPGQEPEADGRTQLGAR